MVKLIETTDQEFAEVKSFRAGQLFYYQGKLCIRTYSGATVLENGDTFTAISLDVMLGRLVPPGTRVILEQE